MKLQSIGIIGGAGPLAGVFLLERIFSLCGKIYGCYRDADFPKVFLISFPFSEMLCSSIDTARLREELHQCLRQLRQNGASVLAIACHTLHVFLDEKEKTSDLVHLPLTLAEELPPSDIPLVFCSSTSAKFRLHKQFFSCSYPPPLVQARIDSIIDQILKGTDKQVIVEQLENLIQEQTANTLILGCTELSLFAAHFSLSNKLIIDPLEIVANKILKKIFIK